MYCKNCGKPLAGDERFCSNCGTKVKTDNDTFETQDGHSVAVESFPTSEMVWDLNDFEVPATETNEESDFQWGSKDIFVGEDDSISDREQDAADYKGPLMFRKDDKAPSKEEIEKKEKEEESNKKSTLYVDDGNKGEGHRWDITKVEIPNAGVELNIDDIPSSDSDEDKEDKKEFIGFARRDEVDENIERNAGQTKEELQAMLDQAIDEEIEKDFPAQKEKKDIVFNWNQNVDLESFESQSEKDSNYHKSQIDMEIDENVVDNNMSLTLEELSAGVNIKSDNIPASNYDESKKTIRNVLSKEAIKKTINFSMDEIKAQQEKIAIEEEKKAAIERERAEKMAATEAAKKAEEEAAIEAMKMKAIRAARQAERAAKLEIARAAKAAEDAKKAARTAEMDQPIRETSSHTSDGEKVDQINRIVDIEQPKKSNISLEVHKDNITGDKIEKVIDDEPKVPEESLKSSAPSKPEFTHREISDDIKVGEIQIGKEKDVMDQILSSSEENNNDDDDKVKFYTFNKNKEEFQKLLDQEYKRLEGNDQDTEGFEADIAGFMNVERGKNIEATSQIEEMNKARSVFLNRPSYDEVSVYEDADFDQNILETQAELDKQLANVEDISDTNIKEGVVINGEDQENQAIADITPDKVRIVFEPQKEESLAETLIEKEMAKEQKIEQHEVEQEEKHYHKDNVKKQKEEADNQKDYLHEDVGKLIIDPNEMSKTEKLASDFFDEEDDIKHRSKGKNFLCGIIIVIIIIIVALLGIKVIIPESPISKVMDDMGNKVVSTVAGIFGGDEGEDVDKNPIRETVIDDKTKLIKAKIDKNYNNNIEKIINDDNLAYDPNTEYDLSGLVDAKDIQTVLWYEDNKDVPYYYDEEIVGTIIEFISMKSAWKNKEDKAIFSVLSAGTEEYDKISSMEKNSTEQLIAVLAIGDIKVAGNAYYVWTAETVNDDTVKRVYEIKEQNQRLYVNDDCEI